MTQTYFEHQPYCLGVLLLGFKWSDVLLIQPLKILECFAPKPSQTNQTNTQNTNNKNNNNNNKILWRILPRSIAGIRHKILLLLVWEFSV